MFADLAAAIRRSAVLPLACATFIWAANAVAGRLAIGHVSPMALSSLRWIIVLAVLGLAMRKPLREHWPVLRPRLAYCAMCGLLGYTLFSALLYWSAHHTTAINITIIQGAIPIFVLVGALLVFGTPIRAAQMVGVALTLVGILTLASGGSLTRLGSLSFNVGDLGMLVAGMGWAVYTLALRYRPKVPDLVFFTAMAVFAFLGTLPLLAAEIATGNMIWPITPRGIFLILFIGTVPSLVSQLLYMRGVALIGPGRAGAFVNLVPVFGAVLGVAVLGEAFTLAHAAALVLVIGGILLAERAQRR